MRKIVNEILTKLNKIDSLENQMKIFSEQQAETNSRLLKVEFAIENTINEKFNILFEDRGIIHKKLEIMENQLIDLTEGQTKADMNFIKIDKNISELKTDVSGLKTDVSGLKKNMSKMQVSIEKIERDADINNKKVQSRLDEITENTKDIKKRLDNQDIKIQVIDNRTKAI